MKRKKPKKRTDREILAKAQERFPRVMCWHGVHGQRNSLAWLRAEADSDQARQAWWWAQRLPVGVAFRLELWATADGSRVYPLGEWVATERLRPPPPVGDGTNNSADPLEVAVLIPGGRARRARRTRVRIKELTTYELVLQPGDTKDTASWSALLATLHTQGAQ